jgi:hypothetical protein
MKEIIESVKKMTDVWRKGDVTERPAHIQDEHKNTP